MGTLQDQLSEGWEPEPREAVLAVLGLADALRYIHGRGLVHRDIKPSNILVSRGIVKLGDFSTLKKLLSKTTGRSAPSTPGWRAPEQVYSDLKRKALSLGMENRIDVYQLGNLLLYLLTGDSVDGEDLVATRGKELEEILATIGNPNVRRIIYSSMRIEPWRRPSSEELEKMLAAVLRELGEK